ncbi:MAG: deoxyguanosinetriphosphate triphosphohydrolase [Gemmataceae bacterium]|nr:deoxyguanosinetriphosphate triphosphohydrolase [Gemmataceae bacterium]MDW8263956.1 deoxyguanosinetriphosphate triphosphohydrolase [Gemmataceae bacterium]
MNDHPLFEPPDWLDREDEVLAPYAMRTRLSKGRRHPEPAHPFRTAYQRDRDRIIHSTAFRRLMYKTQVLVSQTNDHHRTRLTHTLEVAQISRTIARQLGLNEDLTEAIALVHDLGHPPFGHAGEAALHECMKEHGGFEHNRHGLRIVELLEYRYADFPGLNLSWEVLEAQAMHSKRPDAPEIQPFLTGGQPLLEAQVVDAADSLAYDTHDLDDALSVGLITLADLHEVEFCRRASERVRRRHGVIAPEQFQPTLVRALIDWQVTDLLEQTRERLRRHRIRTVDDVRQAPEALVGPSPEVCALKMDLEDFLHRRVYRHHRVMRMATKGRRIVSALFQEFCRAPELLPERYRRRATSDGLEQTVCDYLAGMTDRFAQNEYLRLYQPHTDV